MTVIDYPDREMLAIDLANRLAGDLKTALFTQDIVSFAVSGGSSPGPVFDALCGADLDWSRVCVVPTDERWVPETHARSNAAMIKERLLQDKAAAAQFLPLYAEADAPEDVLYGLMEALAPAMPISVLLLGMGPDMHVASLFPDAPELAEGLAPDAPILVAQRPESQPDTRVSLSARYLGGAMSKHLLITGAEKRTALERAMILPPEKAPVNAILLGTTIHWAE